GQVVDGHDLGRPGGRRDEVGPPHDVVAPDPQVDAGVVGPPPQLVQRPGGHGPVDDGDARRDDVAEPAPAPPGHGEPGEGEVVAAGQPAHQLVDHDADAGEGCELGGEVDGHPE